MGLAAISITSSALAGDVAYLVVGVAFGVGATDRQKPIEEIVAEALCLCL